MVEGYENYFLKNSDMKRVEEMLAKAGNRSERRKILKAMNKTDKIAQYTKDKISKDAEKEIEERTNDSFGYIMAMIGILLHDKYGWKDCQIEDIFVEISDMMSGEWSNGKSVDDVAQELFEKTGIELVVR